MKNLIWTAIILFSACVSAIAANPTFATFSNSTFSVDQNGNSIRVISSPVATNALFDDVGIPLDWSAHMDTNTVLISTYGFWGDVIFTNSFAGFYGAVVQNAYLTNSTGLMWTINFKSTGNLLATNPSPSGSIIGIFHNGSTTWPATFPYFNASQITGSGSGLTGIPGSAMTFNPATNGATIPLIQISGWGTAATADTNSIVAQATNLLGANAFNSTAFLSSIPIAATNQFAVTNANWWDVSGAATAATNNIPAMIGVTNRNGGALTNVPSVSVYLFAQQVAAAALTSGNNFFTLGSGASSFTGAEIGARQVFPVAGTLTNLCIQIYQSSQFIGVGTNIFYCIYTNGVASGLSGTLNGNANGNAYTYTNSGTTSITLTGLTNTVSLCLSNPATLNTGSVRPGASFRLMNAQ